MLVFGVGFRLPSPHSRVTITTDFLDFFERSPAGVFASNVTQEGGFPHAVILVRGLPNMPLLRLRCLSDSCLRAARTNEGDHAATHLIAPASLHHTQIGYNNDERYWIAQNSYGSSFADGGLFRVAYGSADMASPNETYAITCSSPAAGVQPGPGKRWPLRLLKEATNDQPACYMYRAHHRDYLAGIAEHFGLPLLRLIAQNQQRKIFPVSADGTPDLTSPLSGKMLVLCGITADLAWTAQLGEWGPQATHSS